MHASVKCLAPEPYKSRKRWLTYRRRYTAASTCAYREEKAQTRLQATLFRKKQGTHCYSNRYTVELFTQTILYCKQAWYITGNAHDKGTTCSWCAHIIRTELQLRTRATSVCFYWFSSCYLERALHGCRLLVAQATERSSREPKNAWSRRHS